ncbi:hypothetical protein L6452_37294 [Arctium lappa]|uniref:Uncharacterized protein n=1 Tax=Arctium lappa TaxID=4217 RepID=A0ACB8Y3M0_ARCLA|nr:hypothetical protein L6452_37294 [Arctium lappa]
MMLLILKTERYVLGESYATSRTSMQHQGMDGLLCSNDVMEVVVAMIIPGVALGCASSTDQYVAHATWTYGLITVLLIASSYQDRVTD